MAGNRTNPCPGEPAGGVLIAKEFEGNAVRGPAHGRHHRGEQARHRGSDGGSQMGRPGVPGHHGVSSGQNSGQGFTSLAPFDERHGAENSAQAIARRATQNLSGQRDATITMLSRNDAQSADVLARMFTQYRAALHGPEAAPVSPMSTGQPPGASTTVAPPDSAPVP